MFKAKLIEDKKAYSRVLNESFFLAAFIIIPMFILSFFRDLSIEIKIMIISVYATTIWLLFRNKKEMISFVGKNFIEIDKHEIRVKSKSGMVKEVLKISNYERIIFSENLRVAQDDFEILKDEIKRNPESNFLILKSNKEERRFDFEIDSHYMAEQLRKIISSLMKGEEVLVMQE